MNPGKKHGAQESGANAPSTESAELVNEAEKGQEIEKPDENGSGIEKNVGETKNELKEPKAMMKKAPDLLGNDTHSDCECWPEQKPSEKGQEIEKPDENGSGTEKNVGENKNELKEPKAVLKKAPALLGSDTHSDCECWPESKPCGIPGDESSLESNCCCLIQCEYSVSDKSPEKLDGTAKSIDMEAVRVRNKSDEKVGSDYEEGKKTKFNLIPCPYENTGKLQSPIAITLNDLVAKSYPALEFSPMYNEWPDRIFTVLRENFEVFFKYHVYASPRISGGPLKSKYKFLKFEFHWGAVDNEGSEHTIDGKAFVMELHAVHIQEELTQETAKSNKNGYAIVGYFFEVGNEDHPVISALLDNFQTLDYQQNMNKDQYKDQFPSEDMRSLFAVSDMIDMFSDSYVTYEGSLTAEPFSENVTWILAPYCIKISAAQMDRFRSLKGIKSNNFREEQDRHDRVINIVDREDNIFRRMAKLNDTS